MSARARVVAALAALVVLVAGCRGQVDVNVRARPDGSGQVQVVVSLDREAAAKAGDVAELARLGDLRRTGWRVDGPGPTASVLAKAPVVVTDVDGRSIPGPLSGQAVALTHEFANVGQANALLGSLSGATGPLRGLRLSRSSSFSSTKVVLEGRTDLRAGLDGFGDAALVKALGGRSLTRLATSLNGGAAPAGRDVVVRVRASGSGLSFGPSAGTTAALGDAPRGFRFEASQRHTQALLLAALAVLLAVAALVLFALPRLPGRPPPPPPGRKRQLRSADAGWELVARRNPSVDTAVEPRARRPARHRRPRGRPPAWRDDP